MNSIAYSHQVAARVLSGGSTDEVHITRITNACVLIEIGPFAVLTDPWFRKPWGFNEGPGLAVGDLPPLTAIVGSHFAMDHWGIDALQDLPDRETVRVLTSTTGMAKRALKNGFLSAKWAKWEDVWTIENDLTIEVVEAQTFFGMASNNYVLTWRGNRIFFGGETNRLDPLRRYREKYPPVDIAILPSNGMQLLGMKLVTTALEAQQAAEILGARTLIPIHDSMHHMVFGGPTSSADEARRGARASFETMLLGHGVRTAVDCAAAS